ncbi:hypothetical protein KKF61_07530 [Patescibacteria group bacterium]|nr:hypothetical protein [Patescibacteria group bacterium]
MKKNIKRLSSTVLIVFALSLAVGSIALSFASNSAPGVVMETVNIETFNEAQAVSENDDLGRMFDFTPYECDNNECVWTIHGDCTDASLDIVSLANPWGVTSSSTSAVVDMVRITIDAVATSSSIITCGGATAANATPTYDLMTTGTIATSTGAGCVIENGLLTADNGNSACADGGSIQKIGLTPIYPYFNCEISAGAGSTAGITDTGNTFDCDYVVQFKLQL